MKQLMKIMAMVMLIGVIGGCTEEVSPGYVGMIMAPEGLTGEPLQPGRHLAYGRDKLVLVETKEIAVTEKMEILCNDSLNFKFDLVVRTRLESTNGKAIKELLNKQGSNMSENILKIQPLYKTYVKPAARNIARGVVGKYDTTQIQGNRAAIQKAIVKDLRLALKGTPMTLVAAYPSNFDYPEVITNAVEARRKREIQVKEEEAKQTIELLKAENRREIADQMKVVRTKEAQAEAAYIQIVGSAITQNYLRRLEVQAQERLYDRVAPGDKVIVTGNGSAIPMVGK